MTVVNLERGNKLLQLIETYKEALDNIDDYYDGEFSLYAHLGDHVDDYICTLSAEMITHLRGWLLDECERLQNEFDRL